MKVVTNEKEVKTFRSPDFDKICKDKSNGFLKDVKSKFYIAKGLVIGVNITSTLNLKNSPKFTEFLSRCRDDNNEYNQYFSIGSLFGSTYTLKITNVEDIALINNVYIKRSYKNQFNLR